MKMSSYQYKKSHCGDKTVVRSSYIHNGIYYTGKTTSLYWIRAQHLSKCKSVWNAIPSRYMSKISNKGIMINRVNYGRTHNEYIVVYINFRTAEFWWISEWIRLKIVMKKVVRLLFNIILIAQFHSKYTTHLLIRVAFHRTVQNIALSFDTAPLFMKCQDVLP